MLLPAGRYYIGDPCYVLNEDDYDELGRKIFSCKLSDDDSDKIRGYQFFCHTTSYGDGNYDGYMVDSGTLACIPEILVCKETTGGKMHEFLKPFNCFYDNGVFRFGDITIDTYEDIKKDDDDEFGEGNAFDDPHIIWD